MRVRRVSAALRWFNALGNMEPLLLLVRLRGANLNQVAALRTSPYRASGVATKTLPSDS